MQQPDSSQMDELLEGTGQELQQQEEQLDSNHMDELLEGTGQEMLQQEEQLDSNEMDELLEGTGQEMQQQEGAGTEEVEGVDEELPEGSDQTQQQEAEGMDEELPEGSDQTQQQEADGMDEELPEVIEQEMQEQEAEGMDLELEGTSNFDESEDSSDSDEFEELHPPPPLPPPGVIVDNVRVYLPPLTSPSLIAERPPVLLMPCDRRADWSNLPIEALDNIYNHLPLSDIHVMGSVFDENLFAGWGQRWLEEDLVLHDSQIHFGTYKDVRNYIRKHGGAVHTIRIDKLVFTAQNVRSWCRQLRKPEVTGPTQIILVNHGSPSKPLCLEPVPREILLPFNGSGLKKLHLCFFTLPHGGLHKFPALSGIVELGLHGCAYNDEDLTDGISAWSSLERLTLSYASQSALRVVSNNLLELKLCNSSIRSLDLEGAATLVRLWDLDLDYAVLKVNHLHLRSLTVLDVMINYTAFPKHSQIRILQSLLNCFPCLQNLTIKRKDNVTEGQMLKGDKFPYHLFDDIDCLTSHLKLLTFSNFQGGRWEFALVEALGRRAEKLEVLKVMCHDCWSEATRSEAAVVLKEVRYKRLALDISVC